MTTTPKRFTRRHALSAAAGLGAGTLLGIPLGAKVTTTAEPPGEAGGATSRFDDATRDDIEFNRLFEHRFDEVEGVSMHSVTGGEGPGMVLLHGWPQSWYAWRDVLPALARHHTVYAVDLPGLGDSTGTPAGFDKRTLATYVHALVRDHLRLDRIALVAHDLGAGVGFQYAAQYPQSVHRYVHMDYPLPSTEHLPADQYRGFSWHMAFNSQPSIPERIVDDSEDVRDYLTEFYTQVAHEGSAFGGDRTEPPFSAARIDEYHRTYSRPEVLGNGFELYRSLGQDEVDNSAAGSVSVPTMLLTAEGSLSNTEPTVAPLLDDLRGAVEIPKAGHWLAEENAEAVVQEVLAFTTE